MPARRVNKRALGSTLGRLAGGLGQMLLPIPGVNGAQLGEALGSFLPFRRGGKRKRVAKKARGGARK